MVSRRLLRIKALQTLYAYLQSESANYEVAMEHIKENFSPFKANTEEEQHLFKKQQQQALGVFERNYLQPHPAFAEEIDLAVSNAARSAISFYHQQNQKDALFFSGHVVSSIEKIPELIALMLILLQELRSIAKEKNFSDNVFLQKIATSLPYKELENRYSAHFQSKRDSIKNWYVNIVRKDDSYQAFILLKNPSFEENKAIVKYIIDKVFFKNDQLIEYWEAITIWWKEDKNVLKTIISKLIKSIQEDTEHVPLSLSFSENWEEDKNFLVNLLRDSIANHRVYEEYIGLQLKNWDMERVSLVDRFLLILAISEMIVFSNIPIKVTLNEYIEVAKIYGTPKSRSFVNGLLDAVSADLLAKGKIKKTGKGLIDNK